MLGRPGNVDISRGFSGTKAVFSSGGREYSFINHGPESVLVSMLGTEGIRASSSVEQKQAAAPAADRSREFIISEARRIITGIDECAVSAPLDLRDVLSEDMKLLAGMVKGESLWGENDFIFTGIILCGLAVSGTGERSLYDSMNSGQGPEDQVKDSFIRQGKLFMKVAAGGAGGGAQVRSASKSYTGSEPHADELTDRIRALLYAFSLTLARADGIVDKNDEEKLKNVYDMIYKTPDTAAASPEGKEETLEDVMKEINSLVGMTDIKDEINSFVNLVRIMKEREARNLPMTSVSLHSVFYGPPGTGKTTIARLLGRVYKALGLLKSGHLVETDRAGLVAGYVGQTAVKTDEIVNKAADGVLFIDEAYSLAPEQAGNDFGHEAIDALLKRMEDMRGRLAVIVAGYSDEMERFIGSNPGLKSRFSRYFNFDHYSPDELMQIFDRFAGNVKFKTTEDAREKLAELITSFHALRGRDFGNGRFVRNVFERIVQKQADRLATVAELTEDILCEIRPEDIPSGDEFRAEQFS